MAGSPERCADPLPEVELDPRWCLGLEGFDQELEPARQALLSLADGQVGTAGGTLAEHTGPRRWAVASGVYTGDGPATHLLPGPVGFHLPCELAAGAPLHRVLDLRTGLLHEHFHTPAGPVRTVRFADLAHPGIRVLRTVGLVAGQGPLLVPSTGGAVSATGRDHGVEWMTASADGPHGGAMVAAAVETAPEPPGPDGADDQAGGERHARAVDRVIAYAAHADGPLDPSVACRRARHAADVGFDRLRSEHAAAWAARWADADIAVHGDDELQLAVRFALFHLMASVGDDGEAAVGARGLTGEAYRGHVFWDADTFTLPFLAATHPAAARAMLEYRLRRLPAALEIARARGRAGARFPWESAHTGYDVTPTSARDRTGRLVPIRTGQLEDHIVAQVAWAARTYVDWSGDTEFERGPGLRLWVETARFWRSRVRRDTGGRAHIYGVIGPDEYHEPVDDNAFTNVAARWNLRLAAEAVEANPGGAPNVTAQEVVAWRDTADRLVDGYDDNTGIYEQCAGFHRMEPIVIEQVAPRRPIAADLLLGLETVRSAQVVKQADVLMLHHLLPDEVHEGSLEPNLRFYEPRTAHGSSLSPGIHASLFARARNYDDALASLRLAARMDLDDLTGTTAGGLHLATMGSLWQALVYGFAGVRPRRGRLEIDPRVPPQWRALEVRLRFRGARVQLHCSASRLAVRAEPLAAVLVGGQPHTAGPDDLEFIRSGRRWERVG